MRGPIYFLGISAIIANATDLISTLVALSLGAIELNTLYNTLGPLEFFLVKIFLPMTTIVAAMYLCTRSKNIHLQTGCVILLVILIVVFAFATINNIGVILSCL
jgi:hypothetical protein